MRATREQRELRGYLEEHLRRARAGGQRLRMVTVGRGEWLAMGRPDVMLGVRIRPAAPSAGIGRRRVS